MTDGDDKVRARYREIGSEEPPAAIDAAILDAARREAAKPARRSWAVPASIAAVMVLALGLTLRMQQEQPGLEIPDAPSAQEKATPPEKEKPAAESFRSPGFREAIPAPRATPPTADAVGKLQSRETAPRLEKKQLKREDAPASQSAPSEPKPPVAFPATPGASPDELQRNDERPATPAPPARNSAADRAAPAPAAPAQAPAAAPATSLSAPRAKSAAEPAAGALAPEAASRAQTETPERVLERIAELRRAGRNAEADEALERFRREHPGYRIPDAMWEQVKPR